MILESVITACEIGRASSPLREYSLWSTLARLVVSRRRANTGSVVSGPTENPVDPFKKHYPVLLLLQRQRVTHSTYHNHQYVFPSSVSILVLHTTTTATTTRPNHNTSHPSSKRAWYLCWPQPLHNNKINMIARVLLLLFVALVSTEVRRARTRRSKKGWMESMLLMFLVLHPSSSN